MKSNTPHKFSEIFGRQIPWPHLSKCGNPRFDKRGYWQIKWFAENGWTSRFCGRNLKFVKQCGYCGRESDDNATLCSSCGLELSDTQNVSLLPQNFFQWKIREWIGYAAAIPVAFAVSIITLILFDFLAYSIGITSHSSPILLKACDFVPFGLVGLSGVFFGALCLPRSNCKFRNRVFGSLLLLVFGLGFEILLFIPLSTHEKIMLKDILRYIIPTSIGGLAATALHYWRRPSDK
jgi:hypothetical protein